MARARQKLSRGSVSIDAAIREPIRSAGARMTSVRGKILQAICGYEGHFRAADLVRRLRHMGHRISPVTVYRNLPMIERAGVIRRTSPTCDVAWYERAWGHEHHDHLICAACGKVVEFEYRAIDVLQELAAAEHGFRLTGHHLELVGVCPRCRAAEDG